MRKLGLGLATAAAVIATPAAARDGAWYVGGDFGAMIVEDTDIDIGATEDAVTLDHEYGFDSGLYVGYDLGAFRIEAEVAYKEADLDSFSNTILLPGLGATYPIGTHEGAGSTSMLSFMLNGMLDFGDEDGISGFVGAGAGVGQVDFKGLRGYPNTGEFIDDDAKDFAWQVIAGLRQAISDNADLTLKYRFFNVNDLNMPGTVVRGPTADFRSHSIMGGITFNFGGAEPPPPPPPPPPPAPPPPPPPPAAPPPPPQVQCNRGPYIAFFDWDSDVVTPEASTILNNAASAYASCGTAAVMIAGHADKSGSASYNMGLAERRANNVRTYLSGRGIPAARISTQSFGESMPRVPTADGVRELQNRRVEVSYGPGSGAGR